MTAKKDRMELFLSYAQTLDDLDRACKEAEKDRDLKEVDNIYCGLKEVKKRALGMLRALGVETLNPLGKQFDPYFHEGTGTKLDTSKFHNTVIKVEQPGYVRNGQLLRPAKVIVAKGGKKRRSGEKGSTDIRGEDSSSDISLWEPNEIPGYELIERIGVGGFAEVHLARHELGHHMAVKIPRESMKKGADDNVRRKFLSEAKHWKRLYSVEELKDGIVGIYNYDLEPEPHIIMEFMPHGNLKTRMGGLDFDEKLSCIGQLLETLYEVHHLGMVHSDIKPENILLDKENNWKIGDWGLSRVLLEKRGRSEGGKVEATIAYAAPEQIDPKVYGSVDRRTDIYQVGVLAYLLFTGRKPFEGKPIQLIRKILHEESVHPRDINPSVPKEMGDAVIKALSKKKKDRYPDAMRFKKALLGNHESRSKNMDLYRRILKQGLADGKLSADERALLKELREGLHIPRIEHLRIMDELREEDEVSWME